MDEKEFNDYLVVG